MPSCLLPLAASVALCCASMLLGGAAFAEPLELPQGCRIALVGNSLAERMNLFGHFETLLHQRYADRELVVRNFARPADEVGNRQRPTDYTKLDDPLAVFAPDVLLCCFGFNESYAGPQALAKFRREYEQLLDEYVDQYGGGDDGRLRFVLVSPIAFETTGDAFLPDAEPINTNLALYTQAIAELGAARKLPYVDLLAPTSERFEQQPGMQYTINGCHVNETGDRLVGELLMEALVGPAASPAAGKQSDGTYEALRAAVVDKAWHHLQDYRMLNGWYVYGGRRTWDTETFPREYQKIRNMVAVRDRYVWDIAQGKHVPPAPDDSSTGELYVPATRFGEPRQKYSEDQQAGPRILSPEEFIETCTVPPGFEVRLFADERRFPELAKPVQMTFDARGRLWVSTMPSYPQWKPGDARPADKLIILEDTDGDGRADKSTVFYDGLHCPTGFEFVRGGVLVTDQPRLVWLKDTDGDDRADQIVHILDGFATDDTHHTIGAFELSPGGLLHMLEGVAMSTTVETPWEPFRNFGSSGCYVLDPRTWRLTHFNTPGYGNPWCYVFNQWGQGFCGDGTGANQHWDTPLSGAQFQGRRGLDSVFDTEGMRPVVGSEFLISRHFPDDVQRQFLYACVINTNGMPRWTFADNGAGFHGTRVRHVADDPKTAFDLLKSTDKHFRPVDPQIGPDGALWFGDWANPLIGHMQYSQRDPNRDHAHGRIYRLVYSERPFIEPVLQHGQPITALLEQLRAYEWRTRYRARRELHARPQAEVLAAVGSWVASLSSADADFERLRCEALWIQQSFHAVDAALLEQALAAESFDARAAATRVLADERDSLDSAMSLLAKAALDEHPRVSSEAVRGLSFIGSVEATHAVLASALQHADDATLRYTAEVALGATLPMWRGPYLKGELAAGDEAARKLLAAEIARDKKGAEVVPHLQILLGQETASDEERNKAMQAIADIRGGNRNNGRAVFLRSCIACHKVEGEGVDFGPDLSDVGKRLSALKIVESIIDPNAEVNEKFLTTLVVTADGRIVSGLLASETDEAVVIFDGQEMRTVALANIEQRLALKQSSMPEGLAATLSPGEVLDVVSFLRSLQTPPSTATTTAAQ